LQLASGVGHANPAICTCGLKEEKLDAAIIGEGTRRNDFGVVENGKIARNQEGGKLGEEAVLDAAGVPMQHHHARSGAIR